MEMIHISPMIDWRCAKGVPTESQLGLAPAPELADKNACQSAAAS